MSGSNMQIDRVGGRCSLHISAVTGDDEAEYLCEARNEHGAASTVQHLLVNCIYVFALMSHAPTDEFLLPVVCMFACFNMSGSFKGKIKKVLRFPPLCC